MLSIGEGSVTFRDIDQLAGRLAGRLAAKGLCSGDRIALHLPNGLNWIIAYHAIARLGAVIVPCNMLLTADEVGWITDDAQVVCQTLAGDRVGSIRAAQSVTLLTLSGIDLRDLIAGEWVAAAERDPADLFSIGYTSGTTGRPKGATQTHRAVTASVAMIATIHVRRENDRVLTALPFTPRVRQCCAERRIACQ